jgi:excisionase family DNA binding protein
MEKTQMNELKVVNSKDDAEILNAPEVAALLGVSIDTVYSWTMRKAIPHFKLGKMLRFNKAEVIQWLETKRVEPNA